MGKAGTWLKYWGQLLGLPTYECVRLLPRKKKIWLFGSTFGRRFADNPRYFYLYCKEHAETYGIWPVWISKNLKLVEYLRQNGCEAHYFHSYKGIYYAVRGKVYLYDNYSKDINFWLSAGGTKINMWHGIPLKKIQADNKHDRFRHPKNLWEKWKNLPRNLSDEKPSDYVLTTSAYLEPIFSSAFQTNHVLTCGYPRTDYLISDEIENLLLPQEQKELDAVIAFKEEHAKAKLVYYMPTFRDSEEKFFQIMDLKEFQDCLEKELVLFCVKLHPKSKLRQEFVSLANQGFKNILVLDTDSDPYVLLKKTDILVTDYSSVYFDFLLLDRPIIFFDYDREEYIMRTRELYFDYDEMTPGEKAEDMTDLLQAIRNASRPSQEYIKQYSAARKKVRDKVFGTPMELASPKLVKEIKEIIGLE